MVTDPINATHIVLTRIARTCNLIVSLCVVNHVLSSKWIVDSALKGKFLPTDVYEWNDAKFRDTYRCELQKTIKSSVRQNLFAGKTFHITPSVNPNIRILTKIIERCGGTVEKRRRSVARIVEVNAKQPESYIILTCTKDLHLLADLMRPGKTNRNICATEYVIASVMTQKIEIERHLIKYA